MIKIFFLVLPNPQRNMKGKALSDIFFSNKTTRYIILNTSGNKGEIINEIPRLEKLHTIQ